MASICGAILLVTYLGPAGVARSREDLTGASTHIPGKREQSPHTNSSRERRHIDI